MTDPKPEPPPPMPAEPPAVPLAYRDVHDESREQNKRVGRFVGQFFGGLALSVLTGAACFFFLLAFGAEYADGPSRDQPADVWAWICLTLVAGAEIALVAVAIVMYRRRRWTGFLVGMLLGVGLAVLPLGLCFAIIGDEAIH